MFWIIIIIIAVCYFAYRANKSNRKINYTIDTDNNTRTYSKYQNMPTDAHEQVEALSQLLFTVYKEYPYANDSAKGHLYLYKNNDGYELKFWYDWDYSPARSIIEKQFTLGPEFQFKDDGWINYETTKVEGVDSWCKDSITNSYYADPVVATLINNCPGLRVAQKEIYESGLHLVFTYVGASN